MSLKNDFGILRYILRESIIVNKLKLPENTVTYGFYWQNRPYTLYRWFDPQGFHLGDYFNIADSVHLSPEQFEWRDLIVDVFISQQGRATVLDEDELPADLDIDLSACIHRATEHIIRNYTNILSEASLLADTLF
ncbi:MAG: DUF402 domain-containing protein [Candidatus Neomarinimicrobiota bacterium]